MNEFKDDKVVAFAGHRYEWHCIGVENKLPEVLEDLINKGFSLDKTNHCLFPSEDIVPKNLQRHFIRGYFDGDGSLAISGDKKYHTYDIYHQCHFHHNIITLLKKV